MSKRNSYKIPLGEKQASSVSAKKLGDVADDSLLGIQEYLSKEERGKIPRLRKRFVKARRPNGFKKYSSLIKQNKDLQYREIYDIFERKGDIAGLFVTKWVDSRLESHLNYLIPYTFRGETRQKIVNFWTRDPNRTVKYLLVNTSITADIKNDLRFKVRTKMMFKQIYNLVMGEEYSTGSFHEIFRRIEEYFDYLFYVNVLFRIYNDCGQSVDNDFVLFQDLRRGLTYRNIEFPPSNATSTNLFGLFDQDEDDTNVLGFIVNPVPEEDYKTWMPLTNDLLRAVLLPDAVAVLNTPEFRHFIVDYFKVYCANILAAITNMVQELKGLNSKTIDSLDSKRNRLKTYSGPDPIKVPEWKTMNDLKRLVNFVLELRPRNDLSSDEVSAAVSFYFRDINFYGN